MSIRYLALELYRLEKEKNALEKKFEEAVSVEERGRLEFELFRLKAQIKEMRATLEAKKEPPTYPTDFRRGPG